MALPAEFRDRDAEDRSGTGARRILPSYHFRSQSRRAEREGRGVNAARERASVQ